jgi:hypothetical protein
MVSQYKKRCSEVKGAQEDGRTQQVPQVHHCRCDDRCEIERGCGDGKMMEKLSSFR